MVVKHDQERIKTLLKDTITLLCKNGLTFESEFSIEALIGITLDKQDVFLVNINEIVETEKKNKESGLTDDDASNLPESVNEPRASLKRKFVKSEPSRNDQQEQGSSSDNDEDNDDNENYSATDNPISPRTDNSNSTSDGPKPRSKRKKVVKIETEDDDIVYVKQEIQDSWSDTPGTSNQQLFPDFMSGEENLGQDSGQMGDGGWTDVGDQPQFLAEGIASTSTRQMGEGDMSSQDYSEKYKRGRPKLHPHLTSGKWICDLCQMTFSSKPTLVRHKKRHAGDFPYFCSICGRGFMSKCDLKGHLASHTGEREHKCSVCEAAYRYKSDLNAHMKSKHYGSC